MENVNGFSFTEPTQQAQDVLEKFEQTNLFGDDELAQEQESEQINIDNLKVKKILNATELIPFVLYLQAEGYETPVGITCLYEQNNNYLLNSDGSMIQNSHLLSLLRNYLTFDNKEKMLEMNILDGRK